MMYYSLSVIWHRVAPLNAVFGARDVIYPVLLFYVLTQLDFDDRCLKRVVRWVFRFASLQLLVLLLQWIWFYAQTGSLFIEDLGVGLMGPSGAHKLGYFSSILLLAYLGFLREGVYHRKLMILALFATVLISSTRAAIITIPIAVTLLFFRSIWKHRRLRWYWIGTLVALFLATQVFLLLPDTGRATLNVQTLYYQQTRNILNGRYTRIGFLRYTWELLRANNSLLWGVGPGWYAGKTASRLGSPYFEALPQGVDVTLSQVSLTLGEYGIVGVLIISFIHAKLYLYASRLCRRSPDLYLRGVAAATMGSVIVYGISTLWNNLFEIQQVAIIPWLFGGSTLAIAYQVKRRDWTERSTSNKIRPPGVEGPDEAPLTT